MSDCLKASYTLFVALRLLDSPEEPTGADLEATRRHLMSCAECRAAIPEEVCGRFAANLEASRDRGVPQSGQLQRS